MVLLETLNLLHMIGIAWGVGGSTIGAILLAKAGKDRVAAPHLMKLMPPISKLIWLGIILLIASGIGLVPLVTWPMDPTILLIKHMAVIVLVVNGIILGLRGKAKKDVRLNALIGLILWYLITVLSVVM